MSADSERFQALLEKILLEVGAVRASQKHVEEFIHHDRQVSTISDTPIVTLGYERKDSKRSDASAQSFRDMTSVESIAELQSRDVFPDSNTSKTSVQGFVSNEAYAIDNTRGSTLDYPCELDDHETKSRAMSTASSNNRAEASQRESFQVLGKAFADNGGAKYLKSRTMCLADKAETSNRVSRTSRRSRRHVPTIFTRIVFHHAFEPLSAALIILHAVVIGFYVNALASSQSGAPTFLKVLNLILVAAFVAEVLMKIAAEKLEFFTGKEYCWNYFDLVLAFSVAVEICSAVIVDADDHRKTVQSLIKMAEIIRTFRVLRIFRVLRFSHALRMIIGKIFASLQALFWVLVLIFLLIYVMAVCITNGATQYLQDEDSINSDTFPVQSLVVITHFGSVAKSLLTVFQAIAGGLVWGEIQDSLEAISGFYTALFLAFIGFTLFAVLNIITGIFVDAALQAAVHERDLIMERHAQFEEVSVEHLREVFFDMDLEETGWLNQCKFRECLKDERVRAYMSSLKIDTTDAAQLFRMLDNDNSGEILIDEFVEGCMKLRGDAKSMDVHILICESRRMWTKFGGFCEKLVDSLEDVSRSVNVKGAVRDLQAPSLFTSAANSRRNSFTGHAPALTSVSENSGGQLGTLSQCSHKVNVTEPAPTPSPSSAPVKLSITEPIPQHPFGPQENQMMSVTSVIS